MRLTVKYSELFKQFLGIIIIMLSITFLYILIMLLLRSIGVSQHIMTIYIVGGSVMVTLASIFFLRKYILVEAEAEYDAHGIHFQFKNYSSLYKANSVSLMYDDIEQMIFDETESYRVFVKFKTRSTKKTILISPHKYANNAAFIAYWSDVKQTIQQKIKR